MKTVADLVKKYSLGEWILEAGAEDAQLRHATTTVAIRIQSLVTDAKVMLDYERRDSANDLLSAVKRISDDLGTVVRIYQLNNYRH